VILGVILIALLELECTATPKMQSMICKWFEAEIATSQIQRGTSKKTYAFHPVEI
jgi:hypothetical protein